MRQTPSGAIISPENGLWHRRCEPFAVGLVWFWTSRKTGVTGRQRQELE